jgi:hypothetical protein
MQFNFIAKMVYMYIVVSFQDFAPEGTNVYYSAIIQGGHPIMLKVGIRRSQFLRGIYRILKFTQAPLH